MWRKGLVRREHSTVCITLEERLGFKPMPESWQLPQPWSSTVLLAQRKEGRNNLEKNTEPRT